MSHNYYNASTPEFDLQTVDVTSVIDLVLVYIFKIIIKGKSLEKVMNPECNAGAAPL